MSDRLPGRRRLTGAPPLSDSSCAGGKSQKAARGELWAVEFLGSRDMAGGYGEMGRECPWGTALELERARFAASGEGGGISAGGPYERARSAASGEGSRAQHAVRWFPRCCL